MSQAKRAKRDRERARLERAAVKRARRQGDGPEDGSPVDDETPRTGPRLSQDDALAALAALHERFADEQIDFDEFETKKAEILAHLDV